MLNGKAVLITGGSGSFGNKFVEVILRDYPGVKKIIIYSRGELKQFNMRQKWPEKDYPQIKYFIGDVRDKDRLIRACEGVDVIIHAAAMKQVDTAEYNPDECIKTNVNGAQNVIAAALAGGSTLISVVIFGMAGLVSGPDWLLWLGCSVLAAGLAYCFRCVMIRFENGARASFNVGMILGDNSNSRFDRLYIHGTKGSIRSEVEYNR